MPPQRLGECIDEVLTLKRLKEALGLQVEEIICRMLVDRHGQYSYWNEQVTHDDIGFDLAPNILIMNALFQISSFHQVIDEIGGLAAVYAKSDRFSEELATMHLSAKQSDLLPLFEDIVGLEQICAKTALNHFEVCRLIWVLLTTGALRRVE